MVIVVHTTKDGGKGVMLDKKGKICRIIVFFCDTIYILWISPLRMTLATTPSYMWEESAYVGFLNNVGIDHR